MVRTCHARRARSFLPWGSGVGGKLEEVVRVSGKSSGPLVQDHVALDEIELYGELMIAASAAAEDRLSPARIDEVLRVGREPERKA